MKVYWKDWLNMLVMGIDTSTEIGAIGLIKGNKVLGEINLCLHRRHSERLMPNIDYLFQESGFKIDELEGLAVTIGPGSFTGLRIGLSTVKAFAQILEIPVIGLSTLDVIAYNIYQIEGWLVPIIDAHRKRVYTSLYNGGNRDIIAAKKWDDQALAVDRLIARLSDFAAGEKFYLVGNGVSAYQKRLQEVEPEFVLLSPASNQPRGSIIAELGQLYLEQGKKHELNQLLPNYLKKPQAEINRRRKLDKGEQIE